MENERQKPKSRPLAFCAMMAALGTMLMLTGGLIPVLTYCSPLLASFCLIPALDAYGKRNAWMVWAVTSALSLLIGVDKEASLFYLFLGWYPI
jgi:riboflavin transporter FmnP